MAFLYHANLERTKAEKGTGEDTGNSQMPANPGSPAPENPLGSGPVSGSLSSASPGGPPIQGNAHNM